jgi:hypothetical protein
MPLATGFIPPCIPTRAFKVPSGPDWIHEVKHDGYRLQVRREGDTVRLFIRRGYDWSDRYPAIAVTATLLRARSFTLDGEAVVCGPVGIGAGPCAGLIGGIGPPELGIGTGPCASPIGGVGPPQLGTGAERFALSTVATGVDCGATAPPTFVSARTEMGTTAKAIPHRIVTAERSAVLRWAVRLRAVISASGGSLSKRREPTTCQGRVDAAFDRGSTQPIVPPWQNNAAPAALAR